MILQLTEKEEMKKNMNDIMLKVKDLEHQNQRIRTLLMTLINTIKLGQNNSQEEIVW